MKGSSRVTLEDNVMDVIVKLAEGNPGAAVVCTNILGQAGVVDPDDALGGLGVLLSLDTEGIYGPRIWMLYKDVCKENMVDMLGVLRARQLGYVTKIQVDHAIDNYGDGIDVEDLVARVKSRLPSFGESG